MNFFLYARKSTDEDDRQMLPSRDSLTNFARLRRKRKS